MRRSALASAYASYRGDARVWSDLDSYLSASNSRWARGFLRPDLSRSPGLVLNSFGEAPNASLLVTYNINNGVQLMGRPVEPPPYEEVANQGANNRDEPPPPYVSRENLNDYARNQSTPFLSAIFSLLVNGVPQERQPQPQQPQQQQPQPEEDNNNGDINGNNTGQVWVRPDSNNRDHNQPI